jgi:hypothetical protein
MGAALKVPDHLKRELTARMESFLKSTFRPGINKESAEKHGFNYVVDLHTEWRGRYVYLCARYRNPRAESPESEFFEVRTTRAGYVGGGRFNLAYMRHTGRWYEVYAGLSLQECMETIEQEELFWPMN